MKKSSKSRNMAIIIMAAMIVLSIPLSAVRSLPKLSRDVQSIYYTRADGYGSIESYMETCMDYAKQLEKLAETYLENDDPSVPLLQKAVKAAEKAQTPTDRYFANQQLAQCAEEVYANLQEIPNEQDTQKAQHLILEIEAGHTRVENVTQLRKTFYNQAAAQFNKDVMRRFPARLLGKLVHVSELELFY